jgi:hypothetical protein
MCCRRDHNPKDQEQSREEDARPPADFVDDMSEEQHPKDLADKVGIGNPSPDRRREALGIQGLKKRIHIPNNLSIIPVREERQARHQDHEDRGDLRDLGDDDRRLTRALSNAAVVGVCGFDVGRVLFLVVLHFDRGVLSDSVPGLNGVWALAGRSHTPLAPTMALGGCPTSC